MRCYVIRIAVLIDCWSYAFKNGGSFVYASDWSWRFPIFALHTYCKVTDSLSVLLRVVI